MPRAPRVDIPGLLQHVVVRGNERRSIFLDSADRRAFLARLSALLGETETACFAWALVPNHLHLLVRPERFRLALLMRRLLTGYALYFNARHDRCGHLFQNRYHSTPCREESHFLELVRYIHLNPVRAGIVPDVEALDGYPWTGHAVIMGCAVFDGQDRDEVLSRFGADAATARRNYREFLQLGLTTDKTPDPSGGRPRGRPKKEPESPLVEGAPAPPETRTGDLSPGDEHGVQPGEDSLAAFDLLVDRVARAAAVERAELIGRCRTRRVTDARGILCFLSIRELGLRGIDLSKILHLGPPGVSRAILRGEAILRVDPLIRNAVAEK